MNAIKFLFFFISIFVFSQENIELKHVSTEKIEADQMIGIDNFGVQYYIANSVFYKKDGDKLINYSNVQLGEISTAKIFNPLKISLFYRDFNTVVVLDNRLAEITKIDFNTLDPLRQVTHISFFNDNTIWIYNQDTQQLEVFDYIALKSKEESLPITGSVIDLASNYNNCWLLTDAQLYTFSYFGSVISKQHNTGFTQLEENNDNLFLLKKNTLYFKSKKGQEIKQLNLPELLIKQFFVTNESLYIYDGENLYQYQLINQ